MRGCGMLLPVASLPSRYGIGAFSREAYEFIDMLKEAGQSYWQILPLGPTGYGDSPYQSFSSFAGNPYFIDLEQLIQEGLLTLEECQAVDFGSQEDDISYERIYQGRFPLLRKAYDRMKQKEDVHKLAEEMLSSETQEYCFYMAVKDQFQGKSWELWDEDIRLRQTQALRQYREKLEDSIGFYEFLQIQFQQQWEKLKQYAHEQGIQLIGDIPIYVAFDSADSWAHPELFQFDSQGRPKAVAGCPPDDFSADGQLWGNPLYNWPYHKKTGYAWWMKRMEYCFRLYDIVRVDHFRGFDEYYSIPYGSKNAKKGCWEPGPGIEIFQKMQEFFGVEKLPIIAEDLGFLTPSVLKLVRDTGFPGMKVLEFAFDAAGDSAYLPYKYDSNCVVYTGTHDNDTLAGWYKNMDIEDREFSMAYLGNAGHPQEEVPWDFIRLALASTADLAVIPVQDYLGLGSGARINTPSTLGGNWRWRMGKGAFDSERIRRCRQMAQIYGRIPKEKETKEEGGLSE